MITAEHVKQAMRDQETRGCGLRSPATAEHLEYDEAGVADFADDLGVPQPWVFAGAVSLGIEIERNRK